MRNKKALLSAGIGNVLEFYDFAIYGIYAPLMGTLFFPLDNEFASLLLSFGVYAIGFFSRPFGAVIFGYLGDTLGRKKALSLSIWLMSFPTVIMSFLPTFESIGILAPILLTLLRVLQGICAGGEFSGSAIFVMERQDPKRSGLYGGLMVASCIAGTFVAALVGLLGTHFSFFQDGWRVAFFLGGLIGFVGIYIRRQMRETNDFIQASKSKELKKVPLLEVFKNFKRSFLLVFCTGSLNGVIVYTLFGYSSTYLTVHLGVSKSWALISSLFGLAVLIVFAPVFGYLSARVGQKNMMKMGCVTLIICCFPVYLLFTTTELEYIILGQVIFAFCGSMYTGVFHAYNLNHFPVFARYTGISLAYSLGLAFIGGTTPLYSSTLIKMTGLAYAPALWVLLAAILSFVALHIRSSLELSHVPNLLKAQAHAENHSR